jgi:hypothetical protein
MAVPEFHWICSAHRLPRVISWLMSGIAVLSVALVLSTSAAQPQAQQRSLFAFTTNDFWLNLHHYLYVLGRAHRGAPDATQASVVSAPDDEKHGLAPLNDEDRIVWEAAVTAYATGPSRQSSVFQRPLSTMTIELARTADNGEFPMVLGPPFDNVVRQMLEHAAPMYRKAWWGTHRAMNEQYVAHLQQQALAHLPAPLAGPSLPDGCRRVRELAGRLLIHRRTDGAVVERQRGQ